MAKLVGAVGLLIAVVMVSPAQVQSAADAGAGAYTTILAQGSLASVNYNPTGSPPSVASVSLVAVNATTPVSAQVTSVTPSTINFVVPADFPAGAAQLIYKPGGQATQWTAVSIVPASLSLFRSGVTGPLVAQNFNSDGTAVLNGLASPAQPGQAVVLWGTGLGSTPQSAVGITLGGVPQTVLYAGAAPGQPGLNQINFQVAAGTPDGCYLPLTVTYGIQSVTSFLSKTSDGQPCHHPFQLSADAMKILDGGGYLATETIGISTGIQAPASDRASRQESISVQSLFSRSADIANYFTATTIASAQPCGILSVGGTGIFGGSDPTTLGAMTLRNGTSTLPVPWTNPPQTDSPLTALPAPVIGAGKWTWSNSGGTNLTATSFDFVLPPPIQLSVGVPLTVNQSQSQTFTWDGSGYDSTATLGLSLTGPYPGSPVVACSVPAQAGAVTLPSKLLASFAAGSEGAVSVSVSDTGVGIPHAQFKLLDGTPLLVIVNWNSSDARPVDFQ
jgi:uncharacterized protein (TIGR03437 family)